jgi:hypothetical protein
MKCLDRLWLAIFIDSEISLLKSWHNIAPLVPDTCVEDYQPHTHRNDGARLIIRAGWRYLRVSGDCADSRQEEAKSPELKDALGSCSKETAAHITLRTKREHSRINLLSLRQAAG